MNLKFRSTSEEIMDDLGIKGKVIHQTLKELDIINQWLGGNRISLNAFKSFSEKSQINSVADLGCGSGYILHLMNRINPSIHYMGIDANPYITAYAKEKYSSHKNITFLSEDILKKNFRQRSFDLIHCCLFLHHFTQDQLIQIFQSLYKQANIGIIINDLHRHYLAYHSIRLITHFFSRSYMVKNDAKLSVARGFRRKELEDILQSAGIINYTLKWKWAFRWELIIRKS
jgi:SAM-dependent methyltransferase